MISALQSFALPTAALLYAGSLLSFLWSRETAYRGLLALALVCHALYLGAFGWFDGMYLFLKVVESPAFLPFALGCVIALGEIRRHQRSPYGFGLIVVIAFTIIAFLTPRSLSYFGPNKLSAWADIYFITDFSAQACFIMAAVISILHLAGWWREESPFRLVAWGFILHTIAQVAGAIWCFLGWAMTFQWVYVHLQSAAVWMFYANYLHLRLIPRWNEKRLAIYLVAGAVMIMLFKYI
ncbi:MAG: hypothetical protein KBA15_07310 [Spirochaetes bacterium]|jgi:ABC-type transport system involved in cytochrome c biogenesis permease subunit|nr:hypothetical protein [Spirochaetota bacterium]